MSTRLKIAIPVAGVGTRMRPHTYAMPKSLLPVAGKTVLSHVIDPLLALEPEEVILVIGHLGQHIVDYVSQYYAFKAVFVEQKELLGLGYAVHLAFKEVASGPVLVVLGDTIARTDFERLVTAGKNVIGLKEVADPRRFGVAVVEDGRIIALEEKPAEPKSDKALIGLYYFEDVRIIKEQLAAHVAAGCTTEGEIQLTDALQGMIGGGQILTPFMVDGWYDCGSRETFLETNRLLLQELKSTAARPGCQIIPPVHIAPSAIIEKSTIGPYVSISEGAQVIRSKISDSIIGRGAKVEHSALEQSLIGEKAIVRGATGRLNIAKYAEIGNY